MSKIPEGAEFFAESNAPTVDEPHIFFRTMSALFMWSTWENQWFSDLKDLKSIPERARPITEHPDYVAPEQETMKQVDWSKAPEEATHFDDRYELFVSEKAFWSDSGEKHPCGAHAGWGTSRYIRRPEATWDGTGLPPVGIKCEMRLWPDGEWEICQPAYYLEPPIDHSDQVVVYQNSLGGDVCYILDPPCAGSIEFRPIRAPEQVAAEEREEAAKALHREMWPDGSWDTVPQGAKPAYFRAIDAGYSKQAKE